MDFTERLRGWGAALARARAAERSAQQAAGSGDSHARLREAESLREQADRLHRDIYDFLGDHGRAGADTQRAARNPMQAARASDRPA